MMLLMMIVTVVNAQGIAFEPESTTMEQAAAKAKAEKKLIFVDCYTQWCGPCKKMARDVFTQPEVGEYMNSRFINLKLDMESAYGAPLAKKWQVTAYPTFIIFNSDAKEIGRFMGGSGADQFIKRVSEKSKDNGSNALEQRWNNGERDEAFLKEFLASLNATYKRDQANQVAEALLKGKENTFARNKELANIFMSNINNPFAPCFIRTVQQPQDLKATVGDMPVEMKIKSVLNGYTSQLLVTENGKTVLDKQHFNEYVALLKKLNLKDAEHYRLNVLIIAADKGKDYTTYTNLIKEYLATPGLEADDMTLARWVKPFADSNVNKADKQAMIEILRSRVNDIKSGKRQAQTTVGNMRLSRPTDELLEMLIQTLETGVVPRQ